MTAETRQELGSRIRQLRQESSLTQEKFALMVNVERSYLARLESGSRNPSIDVIERIACGLNLSLSELFIGVGDSTPRSVCAKDAKGNESAKDIVKHAKTPPRKRYHSTQLPN